MASNPFPLQVYLDSSDFSVLSDPKARTPAREAVEKTLLSWQADGLVQLRFSYVHVIETGPVTQGVIDLARKRFECIKRLCGTQCFRDPFSILKDEVASLVGKTPAAEDHLRDDGRWFPEFDLDIQSPEDHLRETLAAYPRKVRRAALSKHFDSKGRFKESTSNELAAMAHAKLTSEGEKYPLTQAAKAALLAYFSGRGSRDAYRRGIFSSMSDLSSFGDWYVAQWDKTVALSEWLRRSGQNLKESLLAAAERAARLLADHPETITPELREATFQSMLERQPSSLTRSLLPMLEEPTAAEPFPTWEQAPVIMTLANVMCHVARLTAFVPTGARKPLASDMGDLMHAVYLPFADVFRADGFASNAIRSAKLPLSTQVVGNFLELPDTIQQILSARTPAC